MTVRVFDLARWVPLSASEALAFSQGEARKVTMRVNPAEDCRLHLVQKSSGQVWFLARVTHFTDLEFDLPEGCELQSSGECYVHTHDGVFAIPEGDGETFTQIAVRRERNPLIEAMELRMRQNQIRFQEEMKAQYDAVLAAKNDPPSASGGGTKSAPPAVEAAATVGSAASETSPVDPA